MSCDVEVANAEREVDRIDVFERCRKKWQMRQANASASAARARADHWTGREAQRVVQAAEPISLKIDRDVLIAERLERAHEVIAHIRLERARHFVTRDLEPRDRVVMAHAKDAEPERPHDVFGLLDHPQLRLPSLHPVRDSRRQARRCRHVPRRQSGLARQQPDFVFRQIGLVERAAHAVFARRLTPGPIVAAIVGVVAVDDARQSRARAPAAVRRAIELVFAVVAAVRGIGAVLRPFELAQSRMISCAMRKLRRHAQRQLRGAFRDSSRCRR